MKIEDLKNWIKERDEQIKNGNKDKPYPLFLADVVNAINDKTDYNDANPLNIKVHTVFCGGMTYVYYDKHAIMNLSRNYNRNTIGITVNNFDKFVKKEDYKDLINYICFIIENLLFVEASEDEENKILMDVVQKDNFGLYRFELGELEFEE